MFDRDRSIPRETWREALRLALQSAVAGAAATVAAVLLRLDESYLAVLSTVFILQPSIDGTMRTARSRLTGTAVGSVVALAVILSLPGQYASAAAMAVSLFVVAGLTWFRPNWDYGIYAAIALSLKPEEAVMETSMERAAAILLGAVIGIAVSQIVWREPARRRIVRHIARALSALADRASTTLDAATGDRSDYDREAEARFFDAYNDAFATLVDSGGRNPRGERRVRALRRFSNSMVIFDRAVEEAEAPAGRVEGFADPVRDVREAMTRVLSCLAENRPSEKRDFDRIDRAVDDAASAAREPGGGPMERQAVGALVFGLTEVKESLRELASAVEERRGDGRTWLRPAFGLAVGSSGASAR